MNIITRYDITWEAHEDGPVLTVEINPAVCTLDTLFGINDAFDHADERLAAGRALRRIQARSC